MDLDVFLTDCQRRLGYLFQDTGLLRTALTHASGAASPLLSNERMEFLGDAVLGYIICDYLYERLPGKFEGEMTKIKSTVVSRTTCYKICKEIGLDHFLILGRGLGRAQYVPDSIYANTLEAVIAAIYLDGGMGAVRGVVLRIFENVIDEMIEDSDAYNQKSVLQNYTQKHMGTIPEYKVLDVQGPEHRKTFHVHVKIGERSFPSAWGITKKEAEQRAAENALAVLHGYPVPFLPPPDSP
ncbi:MAG: ribonuclease III [Planctomycetaceae bacterium]|jgi:ribonuclease-3|nr:ribonuclease III [Planctomycetaceae bacterium]